MSTKSALKAEIRKNAETAKTIAEKAEGENRGLNADERTAIQVAMDAAMDAKNRLDNLDKDEEMMKQFNILGLEVGELAKGAEGAAGGSGSVGARFMENERMKGWYSSLLPNGGYLGKDARVQSPQIQFGGVKDILSGSDTTDGPGLLVPRQELGLIDQGRFFRDLTVRDLVTNGQTTSDTVHYVREASYTNNADFVPEAQGVEPYSAGAGQVQGKKPQSTFTLEEDEASVKTIAHWIPVTKRALSDAAQVRTLIDAFLRYGLEEKLEDSMLTGDGSAESFIGILETDGIQHQDWDTDLLVTTRKAKTKVRTIGKARASAYLFNPVDNERIDLLQGTNGYGDPSGYIFGNPAGVQVQTLWGLPRIECEAVPEGTGIVADFKKAVLWDREQAGIVMSDSHADFFIRNLVAILAELRAAFTVIRPTAFVEIEMTDGES